MKGSDGPFVRIRGLGKRYDSVEALENDFMKSEIQEKIDKCLWNRVYDIIEALKEILRKT